MKIISLIKAMELSEEAESLFTQAFTQIKYQCDVHGDYHWATEIHRMILNALQRSREVRKELRTCIIENIDLEEIDSE